MMMSQERRIGLRLKVARERAGLTQQALADALGLGHRQTLARIESGERRLSAGELMRAMSLLGVDLDYFTDPFQLIGEGEFSFRTTIDIATTVLDDFEYRAGRWLALYRELSIEQGREQPWLQGRLPLTPNSSFEDAQKAGEWVADRWKLGARPAEALRSAMEDHASMLVLDVDTPPGISGAASRVPGLNCALVNRRDSERRRHFDLAHELFHLLTWDAMPPERTEAVDVPGRGKGWRVERLAENFAAALLMPRTLLRGHWERQSTGEDLHEGINEVANALRVSGTACKWRLYNVGWLSKAELDRIDDWRLATNGQIPPVAQEARPFSKPFVDRIAKAIDTGRLSVKRAASLLDLSVQDLASLLQDYGHETYFEA